MPILDVPVCRHLTLPAAELRADQADNGEMIIRGHAAVYDRRSEDLGGFVEIIAPGAFRSPLDRGDDVRLLVNHEGLPLARTKSKTLELRDDPMGLHVYARVAPSERTSELRQLMQRGDIDQMSFAFTVAHEGDEWLTEPDGTVVRTVRSADRLFDVSVVTFPAYPQTDAQMRQVSIPSPGDPGKPAAMSQLESIRRRELLAAASTPPLPRR